MDGPCRPFPLFHSPPRRAGGSPRLLPPSFFFATSSPGQDVRFFWHSRPVSPRTCPFFPPPHLTQGMGMDRATLSFPFFCPFSFFTSSQIRTAGCFLPLPPSGNDHPGLNPTPFAVFRYQGNRLPWSPLFSPPFLDKLPEYRHGPNS